MKDAIKFFFVHLFLIFGLFILPTIGFEIVDFGMRFGPIGALFALALVLSIVFTGASLYGDHRDQISEWWAQ